MAILFTYGSLRRGQSNHRILLTLAAKFIDKTTLQAELLPTGYPFPAIKEGLGLEVVHGELYEVSDEGFQQLDLFEGNPDFYQRRSAVTTDGIPVFAYYGTGVIGLQPQAITPLTSTPESSDSIGEVVK